MKLVVCLILFTLPIWPQTQATFVGPDQVSRAYALKSHPRLWLDGPNGAVSTRLRDPDGPGVMRNSNYDRPPAQGLILRVSSSRSSCLVNGTIKNCRSVYEMASDAAFLWYMCNQCTVPWDTQTTWLAFAKDIYLNLYEYGMKRWHGSHKFGDALAPDAGDDPSGMTDYGGPYGAISAAGYSIIRDQLSPVERQTIARYFVNGLLPEDQCEYPSVRTGVRIQKTASTTVTLMDNASWPGQTEVGDWVDIKAYKDSSGTVISTNQAANGYWAFSGVIQAKTGNSITLKVGSGGSWIPNFQEGYLFTYPSFKPNTCSMMSVFLMHSDTPRYTEPPSSQRTRALAADVPADAWNPANTEGVTRNITIADSSPWSIDGFAPPSPVTPWKAVLGGGDWGAELVLIEGISGPTVTIRRGLYHHTNRMHTRCASWDPACSSPRGITVLSKVAYGTRNYNTGLNNRELTRAQSLLAIGIAFADDDPRALTLLERSASYFSTDSHKWAKRFFSLTNYSIASYQYGRGVYYTRMAMFLQNSITSPNIDYYSTGTTVTDQYLVYPYWARPWAMSEVIEPGLDGNWYSCYWSLNAQRDCGQLAFMAQLTHPGSDAAKYAWSFLTTENGYTLSNAASAWASTDYFGEGMITWLALLAGYPNDIQSASDKTKLPLTYLKTQGESQAPGGSGYKIGVSRTDWTKSATYLFRIALDAFSDKLTGEGTLNSYGIGKNGWLVYSPGFRQRFQNNFHNNQVDFGSFTKAPYYLSCTPTAAMASPEGLCRHHSFPSYSTKRDQFLWMNTSQLALNKGGDPVVFTDVHGLIRNWRQIVHIKGGKDFVIVMDDIAKSVNEKFRVRTMYPQNGETVTVPHGSRTYTEGTTAISADFKSIESVTGGQEGAPAKVITKWLFSNGAEVNGIYDLPVRVTTSTATSQVLTVCADATAMQPCRAKLGNSERSFDGPIGTLSFNPSDDADLKEIYLTYDPSSGVVSATWNAGIPTQPACSGAVQCRGIATQAPTSELLLFRYKWSFSGAPYDGCLQEQTMRTGSPTVHVGTCNQIAGPASGFAAGKFDNARAVMIESGPTTTGVAWMWHRATVDLGEKGENGSEFLVTGVGANHRGLMIEGSEPVLVVLPINNARAKVLEFTTTNALPARLLVAGVPEGQYRVSRNGSRLATNVVVGPGEAAFFVPSVPSGKIRVENVIATPLRTSLPQGGLQGLLGYPLEMNFSAEGGIPQYWWGCCVSGRLPAGLSMSPEGLLSGTPAEAGTFTFVAMVQDSNTVATTASASVTMRIADPNSPLSSYQTTRSVSPVATPSAMGKMSGATDHSGVARGSNGVGAQTLSSGFSGENEVPLRRCYVEVIGLNPVAGVETLPLTICTERRASLTTVILLTDSVLEAHGLEFYDEVKGSLHPQVDTECAEGCQALLAPVSSGKVIGRLRFVDSDGSVIAESLPFEIFME